jgi:hypothetical protein
VLQELLDEELGTDPTTVRGLTNHLPMALVAKEGLGADADELIRFAASYSSRITTLEEPTTELDNNTWASAIGDQHAAAELRSYFVRRVAESGTDDTLRSHLPELIPGISGAAFHGVIRLAYAIEVSSPSRIAAGLAYLAEVARPLRPLTAPRESTPDPLQILVDLSNAPNLPGPTQMKLIDEEMRHAVQSDTVGVAVASLAISDETDRRVREAALHLYAATDNFTALHGVTGLEAIASIRPWIEDHELLTRLTFQALAAAYLSIGAPPLWSRERLDEFVGSNQRADDEVFRVAAFNDDEHVAKLVYTARRSWQTTKDPLYLAVAARKAFPIAQR